jgi:hypothetical protein
LRYKTYGCEFSSSFFHFIFRHILLSLRHEIGSQIDIFHDVIEIKIMSMLETRMWIGWGGCPWIGSFPRNLGRFDFEKISFPLKKQPQVYFEFSFPSFMDDPLKDNHNVFFCIKFQLFFLLFVSTFKFICWKLSENRSFRKLNFTRKDEKVISASEIYFLSRKVFQRISTSIWIFIVDYSRRKSCSVQLCFKIPTNPIIPSIKRTFSTDSQ